MFRHATVLSVALLLLGGVASAHTKLTSSVPAADASVGQPVEELVLQFVEPVRLTAVTLVDASGDVKALSAVPADTAARFVIEVSEPLTAGYYAITWRAVGADTHIVSGEIAFRVAGAAHAH
jgi:hypothetical protein